MPAAPPPRRPAGPRSPRTAAAADACRAFLAGEDGTTAVEYAVMLGLILAVVIGAVGTMGGTTGGLYESSQSQLEDAGF